MNKNKLALNGGKPIRTKKTWKSNPFGEEEKQALEMIIERGKLSEFRGGPEVKEFEQEFANFNQTKYAIATTSGTTALHTALTALNLPSKSEILVPAMTFVSTASVVLQENLKPVFVDIDENLCLDVKDLKAKITSKTKAIIPVHLFGQPANMPKILEIAKKNNLLVIEDCAQAHGAKINEQLVGTFGQFGCYSFFQTKNLACGEGGMIVTNNRKLYRQAKLKREHGSPENAGTWYAYKTLGYNYNMSELHAAIGRTQLKKLPEYTKKRIEHAKAYQEKLSEFDLEFVPVKPNSKHVYHLFPVLVSEKLINKRDYIVKALQAEGIPVGIVYPRPLSETELFKSRDLTSDCPYAHQVSKRILNFFTDPTIDPDLIDQTQEAINKVLSSIEK